MIYEQILKKYEKTIPYIDKNGVMVPAMSVLEDCILRNRDNLNTTALEVNDTRLTYAEFFKEVEKYMRCFLSLGLKESNVVSICLPVCVEYICSYYALTALGITCNTLNVMFLLSGGAYAYLDERCSDTLICDEKYLQLLLSKNAFDRTKLKTLIVTGDATYTRFHTDSEIIAIPNYSFSDTNIIAFDRFLALSYEENALRISKFDENRASTLNYTSGTTGKPKCMAHSDLAPLFLVASHDTIPRDEHPGDRTLITIPLQHPTGLFYATVLQLAQGKTLVLEPRYDKTLFSKDIITLNINHAVQAKPFYAQLIQDRANGMLKPGDFAHFRNAYSGGEGIPLAVCREINDTLRYAGCMSPLNLGYGRSEEGSLTLATYNIEGRENSSGIPMPGIRAKVVAPDTLEDLPQEAGIRGEIMISSPVGPINRCYLAPFNMRGSEDGSVIDRNNVRWARPKDIAQIVCCSDGTLSYSILGRADDTAIKDNQKYYLFDIKEQISSIVGIQECEVLAINHGVEDWITVHLVLSNQGIVERDRIIHDVFQSAPMVDGVKVYDTFGINATSGKCNREEMQADLNGYYRYSKKKIEIIDFEH